jgi:histidyl-tRNA synthetase
MILGDVFERLGIPRGDYVVKVNNRKILNGVLEAAGVTTENQRMTALRAIDKLDRLGAQGVRLLLGSGRKDESGDFTAGAGLSGEQADRIIAFTAAGSEDRKKVCATLAELVGKSSVGRTGVDELLEIDAHLTAVGFGPDRVRFDPGIVRGLAYYTGPVLEAELTFQIRNEDGQLVRFGSVAGGGRYDDLVKRFTGNDVPATGVSIGVSRLVAALEARNLAQNLAPRKGPVVVLVMDREASAVADYWRIVAELRDGGIAAELYLGEGGMKAQLKYADKRGAPLVVIEGSNERASKTVTLKNMTLGAEQAKDIKDRETWAKGASAQTTASRADLVSAVRAMLDKGPKA